MARLATLASNVLDLLVRPVGEIARVGVLRQYKIYSFKDGFGIEKPDSFRIEKSESTTACVESLDTYMQHRPGDLSGSLGVSSNPCSPIDCLQISRK